MISKGYGVIWLLVFACDTVFRGSIAHLIDNRRSIGPQNSIGYECLVTPAPVEITLCSDGQFFFSETAPENK